MALTGARAVLVVIVIVLAGCSGTLAEYEASPATIPETALEPRGYVHGNTTEVPLAVPIGVAGVSRTVTARTWASGYTKTTTENDTAILVLYTSPNEEVVGLSANPLGHLSNRELVGFVLERVTDLRTLGGIDGMSDLRESGVRNVTVLGTSTQMASYTGTADLDGERVAIVVTLVAIEHGGDVVVALGIHEEALDETANHAALVQRIEHEG